MRGPVGRWFGTFLAAGALASAAPTARGDDPRLGDYFGFLPLEVYKLDTRISAVLTRDLDGDKADDIAVTNNARSRIDLLLSRKAPEGGEEAPAFLRSEVNQIPSDRRMRLSSVPVNKEIVSLQTGDFNGDGHADLAFYGTPAELVILYNDGRGRFDTAGAKRVITGEAVESGTGLAVGDLNRDGKDDLALLGPNELILVYQMEKGRLSEPERVPHAAGAPRMLLAADLDGDGHNDLVILDGESDAPVRARFSVEGGKLGPEHRFQVETPRAIAFAPVDRRPGAEVLTIENQSGRARVLTLDEAEQDDPAHRGRLLFFPLPPGNERGRSLALGDLDGDGKTDVVVTDPASAQFLVYLQATGGGLGSSRSFPGLVGGKTVKLADLDGDGKAEVLVLSEQEKQIGRSVLSEGRLTFPTPLPLSGEPVALEVADLDGDKAPEILYVARTKPDGNEEFALRAVTREKSGPFVPFRWGQDDSVPLKGLPGAPAALRVVDVNRDGQPDVLVFNAYGPPTLLLGRTGGVPPAAVGGGLGPLAGATPAGLTLTDLNGPALILAQNTFARSLQLDKSGGWKVKDQYDSLRGSAQVVGATALDTDGDGTKEVVLVDRNSKSLLFLSRKDDGVYRPAGTLPLGAIDFQGAHVADLDGDGRDDLLIAGTDRFGVVLTGRKGLRLKTLASYESNRPEARLADLIVADLNADGHPDVALTDTSEHSVEIVTYGGRADLNRALTFKVFERKSFRGSTDVTEPRDLAVGDVDGDGRTDLVLIVHDRVLVYRQDSGTSKAEQANK